MRIDFMKVNDFKRGTLCAMLVDAYSFDIRWSECFYSSWQEFDDFFYDNPTIADKYGFVTICDGVPVGHISWDPRNRPKYVEIGHNCIITQYKGKGIGKLQLAEAIRRISEYEGLKRIIVTTNSGLVAKYNYESVGFTLYGRRKAETAFEFPGEYLDYEILLS